MSSSEPPAHGLIDARSSTGAKDDAPAWLAPAAPTAWHRLNPLTKLTLAAATTIGVLVLGGYVAPLALLAVAVVPGALAARLGGRVLRTAAIATLPIAVAVGLVSTFGLPGDVEILRVGPLRGTLEGLDAAALVTVRLFVMAAALALFGLTTPARALVADLERRGAPPRLAFAAAATLAALPALVAQASAVRQAQRARGLDIDGSLVARVRGIAPLVGPVVGGTLHGVDARALALEARAFGRPGRRQLLWAPSDTPSERLARWTLVLVVVALVGAAAAGALPRLP